jgi:hypothetical protein
MRMVFSPLSTRALCAMREGLWRVGWRLVSIRSPSCTRKIGEGNIEEYKRWCTELRGRCRHLQALLGKWHGVMCMQFRVRNLNAGTAPPEDAQRQAPQGIDKRVEWVAKGERPCQACLPLVSSLLTWRCLYTILLGAVWPPAELPDPPPDPAAGALLAPPGHTQAACKHTCCIQWHACKTACALKQ